jgi:hypothetical protein
MPELAPGAVRLALYLGPGVPIPLPKAIVDSIASVTIERAAGGAQSGFELTATINAQSPVQALVNLSIPLVRCIIALDLAGHTEVLMDGIVTHVDLTPQGQVSTISIKGKDLSAAMDLVRLDDIPYPAMPYSVQVLAVLAKYAALGCVPLVIPSLMEEVRMPTEGFDKQKGTDLAYVKHLAAEVGYIFHIEPGPEVGMSTAYWGPEVRTGIPQPALNFGFGAAYDNCTALSFTFDGDRKESPTVQITDPFFGRTIELPLPSINPLVPPLGLIPPIPPKGQRLPELAKYSSLKALMKGIAYEAQHSDAVFGSGTLDVQRYGRVLQPGGLVGVRGTGYLYDGLYYVTKVTHSIKPGSFQQQFALARDGLVSTVPAVVP